MAVDTTWTTCTWGLNDVCLLWKTGTVSSRMGQPASLLTPLTLWHIGFPQITKLVLGSPGGGDTPLDQTAMYTIDRWIELNWPHALTITNGSSISSLLFYARPRATFSIYVTLYQPIPAKIGKIYPLPWGDLTPSNIGLHHSFGPLNPGTSIQSAVF